MRPSNGGALFKVACASVYCNYGDWTFDPKINGWRSLLNTKSGLLYNRHGEVLSIGKEFSSAIEQLIRLSTFVPDYLDLSRADFEWIDIESLDRRHAIGRRSLVVLDIPFLNVPLRQRRLAIQQFGKPVATDMAEDAVYHIPTYSEPSIWDTLAAFNEKSGCIFYEGVVAKRLSSFYKLQNRSASEESSDWIKHRFTTR